MKIELLHAYRGKPTNEKLMPAGIYDSADIGTLAQYLVTNGHATVVESDESDDTPANDVTPADAVETAENGADDPLAGVDLTNKDAVRDLLTDAGIEHDGRKSVEDLAELLRNSIGV